MDFHCHRCGACCRSAGVVRLAPGEAETIAEHLGMDVRDFADRYTRLSSDRRALLLADDEQGACLFLDEQGSCTIQDFKPSQCEGYPHRWRFPDCETICPAMAG